MLAAVKFGKWPCLFAVGTLGESINVAITAAQTVEADGLGTVTRIQTSYPTLESGGFWATFKGIRL